LKKNKHFFKPYQLLNPQLSERKTE